MSEPTSQTTRDVLLAARDLVARGWAQGTAVETVGGRRYYCAVGAICHVITARPGSVDFRILSTAAAMALFQVVSSPTVNDLPKWNDAPDRTLMDVLQAFDTALVLA